MHELAPSTQKPEETNEWDELAEVVPLTKSEEPEGVYIEDRLRDLIEEETGKSPEEFLKDVEEDSERYAA